MRSDKFDDIDQFVIEEYTHIIRLEGRTFISNKRTKKEIVGYYVIYLIRKISGTSLCIRIEGHEGYKSSVHSKNWL